MGSRPEVFPHASIYALTLIMLVSCTKDPVIDDLEPQNPLEGQIVLIKGKRVQGTDVLWDGDSNAITQVGTFAPYFQIPLGTGDHKFKLKDVQGRESNTSSTFHVSRATTFPHPRIEDIGIHMLAIRDDGTFNIWLSVFTANADVHATILVNRDTLSSVFYNAIPSGYFNQNNQSTHFGSHRDSTFRYPIFHYAQHIAYLPGVKITGQTISVQVCNGESSSEPRSYFLPQDTTLLDSDNDGLLDSWETEGYTPPGSSTKIDLKQMGCDPHRKDILVEVDWMDGAKPDHAIWSAIVDAFAQAPILNPNGSQGIGVYIDHGQFNDISGGQTLPGHQLLGFPGQASDANVDYVSFSTYKKSYFSHDRDSIFHYCIFGKARDDESSGCAVIWGNDLMVTMRTFGEWSSVLAQAGTFMHELGHNIGLRHGGLDNEAPDRDVTGKPNQESLMNYRYQWTGVSVDCDFDPEGVLTFSRGMFDSIPGVAIKNARGICDCSPLLITTKEGPIADSPWGMAVYDYDEWGYLKLNFREQGSRIHELEPIERTP